MLKRVSVALLGLGGVGRALIEQLLECRTLHAGPYAIHFDVEWVSDSSGGVLRPGGLSDGELQECIETKRAGRSLADKVATIPDLPLADLDNWPRRIIVDCSATSSTTPLLLATLERGGGAVLANKKPLTGTQAAFDQLSAPAPGAGRARWESTVGAGLPLMATLHTMQSVGDSVKRIEGSLSSTLGFLMTGLESGKAFSKLLVDAKQLGYTEPDPREDLSGRDVARKALILARSLGAKLDWPDIHLEGLCPSHLQQLELTEFLRRLPELDAEFEGRRVEAARKGATIRFTALVEDGGVRVGPRLVDLDSPLGRLASTQQLVEIESRWYHPAPLVLQGRGLGVQATASGALADLLNVAADL